MAIQNQNTKLNVVPGGIIPVVNVSQYDVERVLTFTLYDGISPATLASGTTAVIEGTKPDRKGFEYRSPTVSLSGNVVTVSTVNQMTCIPGTVECKITLRNNNQVIGTAMFFLEVEKAGLADETDISETDIPFIRELGLHNAQTAEAWAVGTRGGVDVPNTDPAYNNSSKYHSEQSEIHEHNSEAWAVGERSHIPVENSDETYHNNSKYYAGISADKATESEYWSGKSEEYANEVGEALNSISAIVSIIKTLFGKIYLVTQGGDYLTTQDGDRLIISY